MDKGTQSLLNILLSVLAPVMVLDHCSVSGPEFWQLGTTAAMCVALALPLGFGAWTFAQSRKVEPLTLFGLLGTILTGVVTIYANTGGGEAIRPDTPWWYAAKEAAIPLLLCGAVVVTAKRQDSLLRVLLYSDSLFDIRTIEKQVAENNQQAAYDALLWRSSLFLGLSLVVSAVGNFILSLCFLLPVLDHPAAQQALEYNYAVGRMTWWGYLVIGVPLLVTLIGVIRHLISRLEMLTGLDRDRLMLR
jgi:hypothetical protein